MPDREPDSFCTGPADRRTLVTGATGFLGTRILAAIRSAGDPAVGLARSSDNAPSIVRCDLHDRSAVWRTIEAIRPVRAIHAAWDIAHETYLDDPGNERWIESSLTLLESLIDCGCRHIVILGTCLERWLGSQTSHYARAKDSLRDSALDLAARSRVRLCWLRVFQPYGPGEDDRRLIPALLRAGRSDTPFGIRASRRILDFIHADDVAGAVAAASCDELAGTFDLGTGIGTSVRDAAMMILARMGRPDLLRIVESDEQDDERAMVADMSPLFAACAWRPRVSLIDGVSSLLNETALPHRMESIASP